MLFHTIVTTDLCVEENDCSLRDVFIIRIWRNFVGVLFYAFVAVGRLGTTNCLENNIISVAQARK